MPRPRSTTPSRNGASASPSATKSKKRGSSPAQKAASPSTETEENGEDDDDAESYEVENILEAKREPGDGKHSYFVSWKGYGPTENSWVHEDDADGIRDLIKEFWAKTKKAKRDKSIKQPSASKGPRKSAARGASSEAEAESVSTTKKRGRKSTASQADSDADMDVDPVEKKKPKKAKSTPAPAADAETEGEDGTAGNMSEYMAQASWEKLVVTVDTVERVPDGDELMVFFRLKDGRLMREDSTVCAKKFPQKLIKFYESNLRWKPVEGEA